MTDQSEFGSEIRTEDVLRSGSHSVRATWGPVA